MATSRGVTVILLAVAATVVASSTNPKPSTVERVGYRPASRGPGSAARRPGARNTTATAGSPPQIPRAGKPTTLSATALDDLNLGRLHFPQPYWTPPGAAVNQLCSTTSSASGSSAPLRFRASPEFIGPSSVFVTPLGDEFGFLTMVLVPDAKPDEAYLAPFVIPNGVPPSSVVALVPPRSYRNDNRFLAVTRSGLVIEVAFFSHNQTLQATRQFSLRTATAGAFVVAQTAFAEGARYVAFATVNEDGTTATVQVFDWDSFSVVPPTGPPAVLRITSDGAPISTLQCAATACFVVDTTTGALSLVGFASGAVAVLRDVPGLLGAGGVTFELTPTVAVVATWLQATAYYYEADSTQPIVRLLWSRRIGSIDAPIAGLAAVGQSAVGVFVSNASESVLYTFSADANVTQATPARFVLAGMPANSTLRGVLLVPQASRIVVDIVPVPQVAGSPVAVPVGAAQVFEATFGSDGDIASVGAKRWSSVDVETRLGSATTAGTFRLGVEQLTLAGDPAGTPGWAISLFTLTSEDMFVRAAYLRLSDGAVLATVGTDAGWSLSQPAWWRPIVVAAAESSGRQFAVQLPLGNACQLRITDLSVAPSVTRAVFGQYQGSVVDPTTGDAFIFTNVPGTQTAVLVRASAAGLPPLNLTFDVVIIASDVNVVLYPRHSVVVVHGAFDDRETRKYFIAFVDIRGAGSVLGVQRLSSDAVVYPFESEPKILVMPYSGDSFTIYDAASGSIVAQQPAPAVLVGDSTLWAVGERDGSVLVATTFSVVLVSQRTAGSTPILNTFGTITRYAVGFTPDNTVTVCHSGGTGYSHTLLTLSLTGAVVCSASVPRCNSDIVASDRGVFYVAGVEVSADGSWGARYLLRGRCNETAGVTEIGAVWYSEGSGGGSILLDDVAQIAAVSNEVTTLVDLVLGQPMWSTPDSRSTAFVSAPPFGFAGLFFTSTQLFGYNNDQNTAQATEIISSNTVFNVPLPQWSDYSTPYPTLAFTAAPNGTRLTVLDPAAGLIGFYPASSRILSSHEPMGNASGEALFPATGSHTLPPPQTPAPSTQRPWLPRQEGGGQFRWFGGSWIYVVGAVVLFAVMSLVMLFLRRRSRLRDLEAEATLQALA